MQTTIETLYGHVNRIGTPLSIGELFPNMPTPDVNKLTRRNHGSQFAGKLACESFRLSSTNGPAFLVPTVTLYGMTFENPSALFMDDRSGKTPDIGGAARVDVTYGLNTTAAKTIVHVRATTLLPQEPYKGTTEDPLDWSTSGSWVNIIPEHRAGNRIKPAIIDRFSMPLSRGCPELAAVTDLMEPFDPLLLPFKFDDTLTTDKLEHTNTAAGFLSVLVRYLLHPQEFLDSHPLLTDKGIVVLKNTES